MEQWFTTGFTLGLVQGLTEFLPISSTGHLIIVGQFLEFTGRKASVFEVAVQLGSIMAVVLLYRKRFLGLFSFKTKQSSTFEGIRGLWLLFLTTLPPGIMGLLLHSSIKMLFTTKNVVVALLAGSLFILFGEHKSSKNNPKYLTLEEITPKIALSIGFFQCLALWPGFSRSAATIVGGMLLGVQRRLAAEYSFLAAVPIMIAATGYDLLKNIDIFSQQDIPLFVTGITVAFLSAIIAIKTFIAMISKITLYPFASYRIALAIFVYAFFT